MANTGQYRVNGPTNSTLYIAPNTYWVIPNAGTNISVTVSAYNSGGSLVTVGNLTVLVRNISDNNTTFSFNGGTANTTNATAGSSVTNGARVFTVAASCSGGVDHLIMSVNSYIGTAYPVGASSSIGIRRGGGWTLTAPKIRRGGGWAGCSVYVRRSGSWHQVA